MKRNGTEPVTKIAICMGSSCFSRGNNRNVEVIQNYLAEHKQGSTSDVCLVGHLCEGQCNKGPNLTINETMYHEVRPSMIATLLIHGDDRIAP